MDVDVMDHEENIADLLTSVAKTNLTGRISSSEWRDVISEYFCQPDSDCSDSDEDVDENTCQISTAVGEDDQHDPSVVTIDPSQQCEEFSEFVVTDQHAEEVDKVAKHK